MAKKTNRALRSDALWILLLSLIFTFVAYVNYRPITGPTGGLFIGELQDVRSVPGAPGYLLLKGFGDDDQLRLSKTDETLALLDDPAAIGKEFTIRAEKHVRTKSNHEVYYTVTSMEAADGSFAYTWEDHAAVQRAALWWELPIAFGVVWLIGGVYLWVQYAEPPKRRRQPNKRKYRCKK